VYKRKQRLKLVEKRQLY